MVEALWLGMTWDMVVNQHVHGVKRPGECIPAHASKGGGNVHGIEISMAADVDILSTTAHRLLLAMLELARIVEPQIVDAPLCEAEDVHAQRPEGHEGAGERKGQEVA